MQGLMTVRAFRMQAQHVASYAALVEAGMRISLPFYATNRWLGVRMEAMGALLVCVVAITCTLLLPRRCSLKEVEYCSNWCLLMTITAVARHYGLLLCWDQA